MQFWFGYFAAVWLNSTSSCCCSSAESSEMSDRRISGIATMAEMRVSKCRAMRAIEASVNNSVLYSNVPLIPSSLSIIESVMSKGDIFVSPPNALSSSSGSAKTP
jgi:hypothetical protein